MRRRDFVTLLGVAATLPLAARAQQPMPVIGFMSARSPGDSVPLVGAFRRGLMDGGFVEGQNVAIEYRWAHGDYARLPALAKELVDRLAAKAATSTIPVVFGMGTDPVQAGMVTSLNRPGGNLTGVNLLINELEPKRLGLLNDLVPGTALIGALLNPSFPPSAQQAKEVKEAAQTIGRPVVILNASNDAELDAAFATLAEQRPSALLVGGDPFFSTRRDRIIAFAAQRRLPAIYNGRDSALAGGLMGYGVSLTDAYRHFGAYTARILNGAKPAELPVIQSVKFELVINPEDRKGAWARCVAEPADTRRRGNRMNRREFIKLLGGAAAAWPLAARAQQGERVRRIGVLMYLAAGDAEGRARLAAFTQALQQLGWSEGRNLWIDTRWATADDIHRHAAELAALAPDVLVAGTGTATVAPLLQATRSVPIVFVTVIDPVGSGFVTSLAQPGGNATGFTIYEYSMSGKWLELLKEIAPGVTRAAVLRDPAVASGIGQFGAVQIVAPSLGVQVSPVDVRDAGEIERAVTAFARGLNGGLIVTAGALTISHRQPIIALAARHKLPAVYPARFHVTAGGLISYGPDLVDQFRRAAGYVDRILKGEKPADLPVQGKRSFAPTFNARS